MTTTSKTSHNRSVGRVAAVVAVAVGAAVALAGCVKPPPPPPPPHCVSPSGADLNADYGVEERLVTPFCGEVGVGETWRAVAQWTTNVTHEAIPPGYVPSAATPIEDFDNKFFGARYVVDAGTADERTYSFAATTFARRHVQTQDPPGEASGWASPPLEALPVGTHTVDVFVLMASEHWDGYATNPDENFLPAGETFLARHTFEAVAGKHERHGQELFAVLIEQEFPAHR